MASNDYYNGRNYGYGDNSYHNTYDQRLNDPLPSMPGEHFSHSNSAEQHTSPFNTPFDDNYTSYNPSRQSMDIYSQQSRSHDPFADKSAIPLQSQSYNKSDKPSSPITAEDQRFPPYDRSQPPDRKQGWFQGKIPYAVYTLSLIMIIVFIVELAKNSSLTHSPIEIHPSFNPMIGPSPYVLIYMGARYVPCMREYPVDNTGLTVASPSINMPCPNTTTTDAPTCTLADLCGFGLNLTPKPDGTQPQPNQWFRFITPIFLHGGIIHIGFNLLLQLTLGRDVERQIGTIRFVFVYFAAGIFGFVFGGNFAPNGLPSMGCSGALFGIIAIVLLDLLYSWKNRRNPIRELLFIILDICLAFVIGLLPTLDNFSHIGGFLTGVVLGICILRSPDALRERVGLDEPPYSSVYGQNDSNQNWTAVQSFARQPLGFFKGRKPLWWAWWLVRVGALVAVLVSFIVLLRNFYIYRNQCSWCKYLSCLPIKDWCDVGNLQFTTTSPSNKFRF